MSAGIIEDMDQIWRGMEQIDPLAFEASKSLVQNDSKIIEGVSRGLGADIVADEAQYNQDHPGEGLAKASIGAGLFFLPQAISGAWEAAAPSVYGAATGTGAEQAALLAAQTGEFGAYGLGKTMESAAYAGGQGSGLMNTAGGLLSGGGAGVGSKGMSQQMMTRMGLDMMNPQQPQQPMMAPPPRQQSSLEPLQMPYGNSLLGPPPGMTREEWERRKRMKGMMQ